MIFDIPGLLSYVTPWLYCLEMSSARELRLALDWAGDPAEYLKAGDVVELGIDGLGES